MKKRNQGFYFVKTNAANIVFIYIFSLLAINYILNIKLLLNNFGDYSVVCITLFIIMIRILYRIIFFWLIKNIKEITNQDIYEQYTIMSDILSITLFGFEIALIFKGQGITWNFFFYLFFYQIASIKSQTNILDDIQIGLKICFRRLFPNQQLEQYSQIKKKLWLAK